MKTDKVVGWPTSSFSQFFDELFAKSWWVILFVLLCYIGSEQVRQRQKRQINTLKELVSHLSSEQTKALSEQQELRLVERGSKDDREWIEQVLMRRLGVIPKGQTKYLFFR
ncbi:hypothetical protein JYU14_03955 [Simkania negevensis]|uniref:Septum formation initiator n=1 Tax=Simkania negevensis TaxID=83561 RepID=A0ABS3AS74_9BACT|nr:hypothetical protein [Simkania negevensis]